MQKNSLKNVESDDNKILCETLLDFFYSKMVLTFWISLVTSFSTVFEMVLYERIMTHIHNSNSNNNNTNIVLTEQFGIIPKSSLMKSYKPLIIQE